MTALILIALLLGFWLGVTAAVVCVAATTTTNGVGINSTKSNTKAGGRG